MPLSFEQLHEASKVHGRKGGLSTLKSHGTEHFSRIGKKGAKSTQARWNKLTKRPST